MKRLTIRLGVLAALSGLMAFATGCNLQWSPYAAKVGAKVVTPAELDSALKGAVGDATFKCLLEASSAKGYRLRGAGSGTYDSTFSAFILTNLIDAQVANDVVSSHKLAEPASARTLAAEQVNDAFGNELSTDGCGTATTSVLAHLGKTLGDAFVGLQLDEDAIAAKAAHVDLDTKSIEAYEAAHPASTTEACLSGIFAKNSADAKAAEKSLKGGASFASMVAKYSPSSTSADGTLGCYTNSDLIEISPTIQKAVVAAAVGSDLQPISYQGIYLILKLTGRTPEPAVDALDQLFTTYDKTFQRAIEAAVRRAKVQVNPEYGTWKATSAKATASAAAGFGGSVKPPVGPSSAFLLNASAVQGPLEHNPTSPADSSGG